MDDDDVLVSTNRFIECSKNSPTWTRKFPNSKDIKNGCGPTSITLLFPPTNPRRLLLQQAPFFS